MITYAKQTIDNGLPSCILESIIIIESTIHFPTATKRFAIFHVIIRLLENPHNAWRRLAIAFYVSHTVG